MNLQQFTALLEKVLPRWCDAIPPILFKYLDTNKDNMLTVDNFLGLMEKVWKTPSVDAFHTCLLMYLPVPPPSPLPLLPFTDAIIAYVRLVESLNRFKSNYANQDFRLFATKVLKEHPHLDLDGALLLFFPPDSPDLISDFLQNPL